MKHHQVSIELSKVTTMEDLHKELKNQLGLPDFYGANYPAFVDCLSSLRYPEDEMIAIKLDLDEVLVIELIGMEAKKLEIVSMLFFAIQQVNERQRLKGNGPSVLIRF